MGKTGQKQKFFEFEGYGSAGMMLLLEYCANIDRSCKPHGWLEDQQVFKISARLTDDEHDDCTAYIEDNQ